MLFSKYFLYTLREDPSDADTLSASLMIRAGLIRKLSSGIYEWLPLGLRVLKKVENIIREEMNNIGGQEVWLPIILPCDLWKETGRWDIYGKELFRLKDRKEAEFCLGPTHEEVITDLVRREVKSYRQLPIMLYQFGVKFRDEIRPRFGIMRAREFYMKDAYSFHPDERDADLYYQKVFEAYKRICERCGFKYRAVEATTGAIGGSISHEFMVLADTGEEEIVWCDCGYGANVEKAECIETLNTGIKIKEEPKQIEEVYTPNLKSVADVGKFLNANPDRFIKTMIYIADGNPIVVLIRGDYEINESKLKTVLNANDIFLADDINIQKITGAPIGFAGPVNLKNKDIPLIADFSIKDMVNAISGANKKDYHLININPGRDFSIKLLADIRKVRQGDICPHCKKELRFTRGIEIGHTFKLGTKYSKSMHATYLDVNGKEKFIIMGCYGIGVSRIVGATIEQSNDQYGIIWPQSIAPFEVIIIPVNYNDDRIKSVSDLLYNSLLKNNIDVILDDRDERAGIKFKDADLIGIPWRITISEKTLNQDKVELKSRKSGVYGPNLLSIDEVISFLKERLFNK